MADLRLQGLDGEDLAILSAHCQDSIVKICDMTFLKGHNRFALVANRVHREVSAGAQLKDQPERRRSGLRFEAVKRVQVSGFDPARREGVLVLLAITFAPSEAPAGQITLQFAAGASVRLDVDYIEAELKDLGGVWAGIRTPDHEVGQPGSPSGIPDPKPVKR